MTETNNADELRHDLRQFTGTEHWYRNPLYGRVSYTDGVKYFAEKAGAWWLVDILATQPEIVRAPFAAVTLDVENGAAVLKATDGNGSTLYSRHISFTDCPPGRWEFYVTDNVVLLPSEY